MDTVGILIAIIVAVLLVSVVFVVRARLSKAAKDESLPLEALRKETQRPPKADVQGSPPSMSTSELSTSELTPFIEPPKTTSVPPATPSQPPPSRMESLAETAPQKDLPIRTRLSSRPPPTAEDTLIVFKKGLASTRGGFIARLASLFRGKEQLDSSVIDEIEEIMITADLGVRTAAKLLERLREQVAQGEVTTGEEAWNFIKQEARKILEVSKGSLRVHSPLSVILVVGVNGVGKTTTIGKLASTLQAGGHKVMLAAADTFRAAAVLQLEAWGRRVGCQVVRGKENADPASVVFDAVTRAKEEGANVLLVDTAGRLHTKVPLMDELRKVGRTVEKALGRPADDVLLVLDATSGQNAIQQVQMFKEALPLSGIALTKLDGTAKGGVILGIVDEHGIPVRFIGIGERVEDLRPFDPDLFVEALFTTPPNESLAA